MTLNELAQLNALREEIAHLKRENESLRRRASKLLYGVNQAIDAIDRLGAE